MNAFTSHTSQAQAHLKPSSNPAYTQNAQQRIINVVNKRRQLNCNCFDLKETKNKQTKHQALGTVMATYK